MELHVQSSIFSKSPANVLPYFLNLNKKQVMPLKLKALSLKRNRKTLKFHGTGSANHVSTFSSNKKQTDWGIFPSTKASLLYPIHGGRGHTLGMIHIPRDTTGEIGDTAQGLEEWTGESLCSKTLKVFMQKWWVFAHKNKLGALPLYRACMSASHKSILTQTQPLV